MEEQWTRPHSVPSSSNSALQMALPTRASESVEAVTLSSTKHIDTFPSSSRPKAPIKKSFDSPADTTSSGSTAPRRRRRKSEGKYRSSQQPQHQSLDESFECLEVFEKNNRGRDLSSTDALKGVDVHFVNIEDQQPEKSEDKQLHGVVAFEDDKFKIPILPSGKRLTINLLSTWGDPFYVGLMGIEIFDRHGHSVSLSDPISQLSSDPQRISDSDPRRISNIMDGHYNTSDELHSWLAPFIQGQNHYIYINFDSETTISMIRIWNINTSRIHSYRGARYVEMFLDDHNVVFKGEITRATGTSTTTADETLNNSECILFTTDNNVLKLIEKYDKVTAIESEDQEERRQQQRPATGATGIVTNSSGKSAMTKLDHLLALSPTSASSSVMNQCVQEHRLATPANFRPRTAPSAWSSSTGKVGQVLSFYVVSNWGDPFAAGLAGIQVLDASFNPIQVIRDEVTQKLPPGFFSGNVPQDPSQMWMVPLETCSPTSPFLKIDLKARVSVGGFKFWNYNASLDDSFRGAKRVVVMLDDELVSPPDGFLIRKAPGCIATAFDYGQFVQLRKSKTTKNTTANLGKTSEQQQHYVTAPPPATAGATRARPALVSDFSRCSVARPLSTVVTQQYQTTAFPSGCIIKFVFLSTWGDQFYIGLNGIEVYDANNIAISVDNFEAVPRDVNELATGDNSNASLDVRTPDKLFNGVNDTDDDRNMWLAPLAESLPGIQEQESRRSNNSLLLLFDDPVTISKIVLWNYSKTPSRGVCDYKILLDDVLIYRGVMKQASEEDADETDNNAMKNNNASHRKRHNEDTSASPSSSGEVILFTNDAEVIEEERHRIYIPQAEEEDGGGVTFINDEKIVAVNEEASSVLERPTTSAGNRQ